MTTVTESQSQADRVRAAVGAFVEAVGRLKTRDTTTVSVRTKAAHLELLVAQQRAQRTDDQVCGFVRSA